jgi:hypothetical protein
MFTAGGRFVKPITFEDGMDFEECELYYKTRDAQVAGGALRRSNSMMLQKQHHGRRPPVRENSFQEQSLNRPVSILRKSRFSVKPAASFETSTSRKLRRCSYTGTLQGPVEVHGNCEQQPGLSRSTSVRDLSEATTRVAFQANVMVAPVFALKDLPREQKAQLWMTRAEMMLSVRSAALEARAAEKSKAEADILLFENEEDEAPPALRAKKAQRTASSDSIVLECIDTYQSLAVC